MPSVLCNMLVSLQTIIDMDREDEHSGRMEEIYQKLPSAYYQIKLKSRSLGKSLELNCPEIQANSRETGDISRLEDLETPGLIHSFYEFLFKCTYLLA